MINVLTRDQLTLIATAASFIDEAAWKGSAYLSNYPMWLRGMQTRRVRSFNKAKQNLFPTWAVREQDMVWVTETPIFQASERIVVAIDDMCDKLTLNADELLKLAGAGYIAVGISTGRTSSLNPNEPNKPKKGTFEMGIHTVAVTFNAAQSTMSPNYVNRNKQYHYLTNRDDINVGDTLVVMSPSSGPACVTVVSIFWNTKSNAAFKYVVDKVDFDDYNRVQQEIEAAANERRRKEKLERELQAEMNKVAQAIAARKDAIRVEIINREAQSDPFIQEQERRMQELRSQLLS